DRYFLERVTDQQYGILGGHLRHLPGGVDEYLRLRAAHRASTGAATPKTAASGSSSVSGSDLRATQKEISAIERKVMKLDGQIKDAQRRQAEHDQGDYEGLRTLTAGVRHLEAEVAALEERWLALSESLG
ncbi:MAG: ABC transporter ATP-binding protein, partial [Microbacteriaceae bacterium]